MPENVSGDQRAAINRTRPQETNTEHGGRGVYFLDPSGMYLELITRPYLRLLPAPTDRSSQRPPLAA